MKKRSIGFILFGIAGVNLITLPIALIIYPPYWERIEMPPEVSRIGITAIFLSSIIAAGALICAGIIVLIKFRKGEIISISTKKDTARGKEDVKTYRDLKDHGYSEEEIKRMLGKNEKN